MKPHLPFCEKSTWCFVWFQRISITGPPSLNTNTTNDLSWVFYSTDLSHFERACNISGELSEQSAPPSGNERKCHPNGNVFITRLKAAEITKHPSETNLFYTKQPGMFSRLRCKVHPVLRSRPLAKTLPEKEGCDAIIWNKLHIGEKLSLTQFLAGNLLKVGLGLIGSAPAPECFVASMLCWEISTDGSKT